MKINKIREFDVSIKTNFLGNNLPKENTQYICIACITVDSVMKMNKKKLSTSFFRRMQVQKNENKYSKIHKQ